MIDQYIKVTVSTGFAGLNHVEHFNLPCHWDSLNDSEKQKLVDDTATEFLHETCEAFGEVVSE